MSTEEERASQLERWQSHGDLEALDALLRSDIAYLKSRLAHQAGDLLTASAAASDVAQEAVFRLLRVEKAPHFEHPNELRNYLWKAAWRLLIDRLRKRGRHPVQSQSTDAIAEHLRTTGGLGAVERIDEGSALHLVLNLLDEADRAMIDCVYFKNMSLSEAGKTLGLTKDAANMRLVRARMKLAAKLKGWTEIVG